MVKSPEQDRRLRGGAFEWDVPQAGPILEKDYFAAPPSGNTVYKGASWAARYVGIRTDSQIYVGAQVLR